LFSNEIHAALPSSFSPGIDAIEDSFAFAAGPLFFAIEKHRSFFSFMKIMVLPGTFSQNSTTKMAGLMQKNPGYRAHLSHERLKILN
jgi:hypothetical protein